MAKTVDVNADFNAKGLAIQSRRARILQEKGVKGYFKRQWMFAMDNKSAYIMIFPFMLIFFTFTVLPVCVSLFLGFTRFDMIAPPQFVGFDNYIRMFLDDDIFMIAVKNTLIFAVITGPVSYFLCFFFAWLISDMSPKTRAFFTVIFYAPTLANVYMIWAFIFAGDSYGVLNNFLLTNNFIDTPILWLTDEKYMLNIVIFVQLWMSLGTSFLTFIAGFQVLNPALTEAGAIDGISNKFQELIYIILPQMVPQLMLSAVLQISSSFAVSGASSALVGFPSPDYAAHTIVLHISDYGGTRFELGYACAMSFVLFAAMLFVKWLLGLAIKRISSD